MNLAKNTAKIQPKRSGRKTGKKSHFQKRINIMPKKGRAIRTSQ